MKHLETLMTKEEVERKEKEVLQ